jgi:hypothetical protein
MFELKIYMLFTLCMNFFQKPTDIYNYVRSFYYSSDCSFLPKYTRDSNLWTTDKARLYDINSFLNKSKIE